jgi:hypothetical protein
VAIFLIFAGHVNPKPRAFSNCTGPCFSSLRRFAHLPDVFSDYWRVPAWCARPALASAIRLEFMHGFCL